jgi:hypothetical protein
LTIRQYIKSEYSIKTLIDLLNSEAGGEFKQMAVIFLKKAIVKHFEGLSPSDAVILRNALLKIYFDSKLRPVKSVLANVISQIADYYFSKEQVWPELLMEISNRSEGNITTEELRDAIVLLRNLLDGNEDDLEPSFPQIIAFLQKVMTSTDPEIVMESIKCLCYIVGSLDDEEAVKKYGNLLQTILSVPTSTNSVF